MAGSSESALHQLPQPVVDNIRNVDVFSVIDHPIVGFATLAQTFPGLSGNSENNAVHIQLHDLQQQLPILLWICRKRPAVPAVHDSVCFHWRFSFILFAQPDSTESGG